MKRFIIAACFMAAISINARGVGQYYFNHYLSEDGIPNNTVLCSLQDHLGFLWFGTKDGICRYNGKTFTVIEDPNLNSCINGMALALCEDLDGMLWCCTSNGTGYYNMYNNDVVRAQELDGIRFTDIDVDKDNNVWFISSSGSVYKLDRKSGEYIQYSAKMHFTALHSCIDMEGNIWFSTYQGDVRRYNSETDDFQLFPIINPVHINAVDKDRLLISNANSDLILMDIHTGRCDSLTNIGHNINCLMPRTDSEYWIGTHGGLVIYNDDIKQVSLISDLSAHELSSTNITNILQDNEGNVWLGTYYGGLNLWHNKKESFTQVFHTGNEGTFYGKLVHALYPDKNGNLWAGTEDGYLNKLIFNEKKVVCFSGKEGFPPSLNIHGLLEEGDTLWIATFNDGLYFFDLTSETMCGHVELPTKQCVCILKTGDGTILIGTSSGLYRYDRETTDFTYVDGPGRSFIHTLYQDSFGTIWVGTYGSGIFFSKDGLDNFESIQSGHPDYGLKSGYITSFFEDTSHMLWVTTEGGGLCWTPLYGNISFSHITRKDGLPSNITCAVTQDRNGLLWVSTTKGIATVNPQTGMVHKVYINNSGRVGNQFSYGSCYQFPNGRICLGTTQGIMLFNPNSLKDPIANSPLYIQDITTGKGETHTVANTVGKSAIMSDEISINQKDAAYLSISFSALTYSNINVPQYEYHMSRGSRSIRAKTTDNTVVFTGLKPGRHHFTVKLVGSDSPESSKSLSIIVKPPFYSSTYAYIAYFLVLASIAGGFLVLTFKKRKIEETRKLEQMESFKQKEIYDAKINFFTNITHEIRTPLSLIKMPVDKIISQKEYTEASKDDIMTIRSNTNRLLELTNQLLDIRKMEKNQISVHFMREDICPIVRDTCEYFAKAAKGQHITFTVTIPEQPIVLMCSGEMIKKIVSNLLSNGIKYCKDTLELTLAISDDGNNVIVRVTSNGERIPDEESEKIFTPFYQIKTVSAQLKGSSGTGLGLPYARTLATLHKGTLVLDPSIREDNSFVLTLPLVQPAEINEDATDNDEINSSEADSDSSRHTILIVEDATEMRRYLAKELSADYNVIRACNGEEGVKIVKEQKIDLVVSDIMMPVMDGCQLCNFIKTNIEYSHIPIILLTAAVGVDTRIESLEVGADGYIEKPFAIELLLANVANLFKNKEIAYRQFANSPLTHFNSISFSNIEKTFMDKLHNTIMKHMSEQDLDIDMLTTLLGTSKSTLYRKIKANSGLNTNEYIRLCRLKKAAEMLSSQEYKINEVAYLVGFSSPSYFTTSFQKQFNISPSAFVKNLKPEDN